MIQPTHYKLTCDEPGCADFMHSDNKAELETFAKRVRWEINEGLSGKDYCPLHRRTPIKK